MYGLVLLVGLWFFIHGGIILYAYRFFSYLTELGPTELRDYIDTFPEVRPRHRDAEREQLPHPYRRPQAGGTFNKFHGRAAPERRAAADGDRGADEARGVGAEQPEIGSLFSGDEDGSPETPAECAARPRRHF